MEKLYNKMAISINRNKARDMFYCLRDPDTNTQCKSSVIIYNNKSLHQWDEHLALDGFDCDLELELYLDIGLFVERVIIPRNELIYESDRLSKRKDSIRGTKELNPDPYHRVLKITPNVSINYIVRKCEFNLSQIHLYYVAWKVPENTIEKILKERGHKITMSINTTYLGRPQLIYTRDDKRTHTWLPSEELVAFDGIAPRSERDYDSLVEETRDLIILKWENPPNFISPRAVVQSVPPPKWDHDHYSNPTRRLPCISRCENVLLQLFNFRFMPPTRLAFLIRWGSFVTAHLNAEKTIQKTLIPGLHLFLKFVMNTQHAEIVELSITADSFNETLLFL